MVALGDGGGIKQALPRPVMGADKVGRLHGPRASRRSRDLGMSAELADVNGWPALVIRLEGELDSVLSVRVDDGLVSAIYTVRNPEKLSRMVEEAGSRAHAVPSSGAAPLEVGRHAGLVAELARAGAAAPNGAFQNGSSRPSRSHGPT